MLHTDQWFMKQALKEAQKAYSKDEAPVGAVIVNDGVIISRAHNERQSKGDATLHAEMTAIRRACRKLGDWRLDECEIYVTLEPCVMCAGAIVQSRIKKLYIGTADPKAGATGSVINVVDVDRFNHRVEVEFGILEDRCSGILKDFFRELRERKEKR